MTDTRISYRIDNTHNYVPTSGTVRSHAESEHWRSAGDHPWKSRQREPEGKNRGLGAALPFPPRDFFPVVFVSGFFVALESARKN